MCASHLARKPVRLHLVHTVIRRLTGFLGSWLPRASSEREREHPRLLSIHPSNGNPANAAGLGFALPSPSSRSRWIVLLRYRLQSWCTPFGGGHHRPWFNPTTETETDPAGRSSSQCVGKPHVSTAPFCPVWLSRALNNIVI